MRRWLSLSLAAVLLAACPAGVTPSKVTRPSPSRNSAGVSPSRATPSRTRAPVRASLYRVGGFVFNVAAGPDGVYFTYAKSGSQQALWIGRFDGRSVARGGLISNATDLAVAGPWLWVSAGGAGLGDPHGHGSLYRLDPRTLAVVGRETLPEGAPYQLGSVPSGLWVGAGQHLYLVDADSGGIVRSVSFPEVVGDVTTDPSGTRLYVDLQGGVGMGPLEELDARTGAVLRIAHSPGGLAWSGLSATADGVWAAYATGNLGQVALFRRRDLRQVAEVHFGTNGIHASVAADILWVSDQQAALDGGLSCVDPSTGRVRARNVSPYGPALANVVAWRGSVYAGAPLGLVRITPQMVCQR